MISTVSALTRTAGRRGAWPTLAGDASVTNVIYGVPQGPLCGSLHLLRPSRYGRDVSLREEDTEVPATWFVGCHTWGSNSLGPATRPPWPAPRLDRVPPRSLSADSSPSPEALGRWGSKHCDTWCPGRFRKPVHPERTGLHGSHSTPRGGGPAPPARPKASSFHPCPSWEPRAELWGTTP